MGSLRLIVGLALALGIASFGVINMAPVTVAYYKGVIRLPLFYVLLAVFAAGFLIAWFAGLFDRLRFHRQIRSLKHDMRSMETDLNALREQSGRLLPAGNPGSGPLDSTHAQGANDAPRAQEPASTQAQADKKDGPTSGQPGP